MIYFLALFVPIIIAAVLVVICQVGFAWNFARQAQASNKTSLDELVSQDLRRFEREVMHRFEQAEQTLLPYDRAPFLERSEPEPPAGPFTPYVSMHDSLHEART